MDQNVEGRPRSASGGSFAERRRIPIRSALWVLLLLAVSSSAFGGAPALRVFETSKTGVQLLSNRGFDQAPGGKPDPWWGWHQGFILAENEGRNGTPAVRCERTEGGGEYGASQTLELDRTHVAPLIIRGWSKAENVSGSPDNGYSLYVDLTYQDGTPLWGRTAPFRCGTHDWEHREFVLLPEKPVKLLTLHCLFRGHAGKVWFDDVSVEEVPTPAGTVVFHGLAVEPGSTPKPPHRRKRSLKTKDGLTLEMRDAQVTALKHLGKNLPLTAPAGFFARDFRSGSDFYFFTNGLCPELGLRLETACRAVSNHLAFQGRVSDLRGTDRAITLVFALPIEPNGWRWGDDIRHSRPITGTEEFSQTVPMRSGSGRMSRYPLAAIWKGDVSLAFGLDLEHPVQYTLGCHPGTKQLFIAFDVALVKDTVKFPSSAEFSFVVYSFEGSGEFRAALEKYYQIFPKAFVTRTSRQGLWMPFADIARVPGYEDFGFAFQEGAANVPFDDQHGIASFLYVEPMSYWLSLPPQTPRTYSGAMEVIRKDLAGAREPEKKQMAAATLTSGIHTADGQLALYLVKAPWCDGGVYTLNPDPDIPATAEFPSTKALAMQSAIEEAFKRYPHATNAPAPGPGLDGVYFDSLEMSSADLNYRRDHFAASDFPLVFDAEGRPAQLMFFNTLEFVRSAATDLHARGLLTFANGALWNFSLPARWLDVMGTEVSWMSQGKFTPDSEATMNFRRALCGQKPYCLLMNTDYEKFTPDCVENYFSRCLFYGMWPGFFDQDAASKDPYWLSEKKWYERDRALFREYIPLLREITSAGWQPRTAVIGDNPKLSLERFGKLDQSRFFVTVFNDTAEMQEGVISPAARSPDARKFTRAVVRHGDPLERSGAGWKVKVRPQRTVLLQLERE